MCGIAGIISYQEPIKELTGKAEAMVKAIAHRGPDADDIWLSNEENLLLAHCRLAIQDLSPMGAQPMHSASQRFVITFNGEIYNFLELRKELNSLGLGFRGHSDTEVLLEGIEHWGLDATLEKLCGMFAFGLFDKKTKQFTLVRDRIGEKPLYYGCYNNQVFFASELKAIFALHSPKQFTIDHNALASYLRYGYINAPLSIFQNIRKLNPGHKMTIDLSAGKNQSISHVEQLPQVPYWSLASVVDSARSQLLTDEPTAIAQLDTLLNQIITEQSIADVPLGAFLSGGIDSSTVAAIAQANSNKPVDTFTIGFDDKSFNEAEHAKAVAKHIGSNHHETYITGANTLDLVPSIASIYDEPFADSSQIPMIIVSQLAKQHVTVSLSGDGGDELFAGYNRYTQTERMYAKIRRLPKFARSMLSTAINSVSPTTYDRVYQSLKSLSGRKGAANVGLKLHKLSGLMSTKDLSEAYRYLSSYAQNPSELLVQPSSEPDFLISQNFNSDFLNGAMEWDQRYYLPGDNLVKSDRASMFTSLEMRLPLLDKKLIEFAWTVPNHMKLKDGQSKWLLRQVLYKYVPKELIERPKMGFSIPIAQWLKSDLVELTSELLDKDYLDQQGIFNSQLVHSVYKEHIKGHSDNSNLLWTILMFQMWYKNYMEGF
ncbi:asparagine synthase (glutamine-hydrolyzing) [Pleionea litopenaei]|uniref:asparagine synthase (glutamine-hydrolyzing) n=1 Tax=Pleionea litopenaei TaxID=3070815 RepID=A0AA51RR85_9GAMM|nr:asparagine synthase (glutamine-hydrolyzing) [Pleionea sp. HL-JVS1]WMS86193.1 asparagine synthase (glutamine-hydrolyzing) [Pleionea sp. HL-JVS1]